MFQVLSNLLRPRPAPDTGRWVVLDVETSGLDPQRDRLLAIAALAVQVDTGRGRPRIALGDSFEVLLRQPDAGPGPADKANILLHGIGVGAQRGGEDPATALAAFERFAGTSPLLAFHAAFDRAVIERASRATLGRRPRNAWLDLAPLAAVLHPGVRAQALDDWLGHFRIPCLARHQAAADTLATAELLLALWPALQRELGVPRFATVARLAAQQRWVAG